METTLTLEPAQYLDDPKTPKALKKAKDIFKKCPACDCPDLLSAEDEVFCLACDWNSIEAMVEARMRHSCQKRLAALQANEVNRQSEARRSYGAKKEREPALEELTVA